MQNGASPLEGDVQESTDLQAPKHDPTGPRVSFSQHETEIGTSALTWMDEHSLLDCRPLSWNEARLKLRGVLESYMKTPVPVCRRQPRPEEKKCFHRWLRYDLDLYLGALPAAIALLVLSTSSFAARKRGDMDTPLNVAAELRVYTSQVVASSMLVAGALISIFLVRSRRYTCRRDADMAKRRTILKFLSSSDDHEEEVELRQQGGSALENPASAQSMEPREGISISGTAITDIYPVYRQTGASKSSWEPVPMLLLVEGDLIALQVGDLAPAKCRMIEIDSKGNLLSSVVVCGGEKVTNTPSLGNRRSFSSSFPRGKSTVKSDSRYLLTLCDRMRIFRLEETPVKRILSIPEVLQRLPQIHRQITAIRAVMFYFAVVLTILTVAVIFVRPNITSSDLSIVLPAPFLAALGALPVTTPAILFFLEVVGTARILMAIHPHANLRTEHGAHQSLFLRYSFALIASRLSLQATARRLRSYYHAILGVCLPSTTSAAIPALVHVPPASAFLLEKLGVSTAFSIVDDELACEPHSTPQQLLIPSGRGMKLLDICQTVDSDSELDDDSEAPVARKRGKSYGSSPHESDYSDSDDEHRGYGITAPRRKPRAKRAKRRRKIDHNGDEASTIETEDDEMEVQFEDPLWWQHLPSLKCIGLASLVADDRPEDVRASNVDASTAVGSLQHHFLKTAETVLVHHISRERHRRQLRALSSCIGFSTEPNMFGNHGDLSVFTECLRLRIFSTKLHGERLEMDAHALGLEESRSWGLLRPDLTSVIVQDKRSGAYQLLSAGDPRVVTKLCREAWQGENSTIFPLNKGDRENVLETSTNWVLADLDVTAFSYSPIPHTLEEMLTKQHQRGEGTAVYLIDNSTVASREPISDEWALVNDQIFLGVLGSSVIPRKDIDKLLDIFGEAGVRFVYFSPRNMRRTKELASQMGIDVAWNCAISLRSLDDGQEDPHRMISTYADWDVNAKLPHGIESVRKHLKEVDNVPLLVSLFTDSTKETSKEMLRTFQDYDDTVIVMGLSHLARNFDIFALADVAVGADVLSEELNSPADDSSRPHPENSVLPHEISFVSAISAHPCAFSLKGSTAPFKMPGIIASGRAALEAATGAGLFVVFGCVTFSLFVLFSMCAVSTTLPFVPTLGSVLYLQIILPMIGMTMAASDADMESMERVPPKNIEDVTFQRQEGKRLYRNTLFKGLLPSALPQFLFLIAFGELMIKFEPEILISKCGMSPEQVRDSVWTDVIRCKGLKEYSGDARTAGGALLLAEMVVCVIIASASFVHSTAPIFQEPPWVRNHLWVWSCLASIGCVAVYLAVVLPNGSFSALPWYFFVISVIMPFLCLFGHEMIKRSEKRLFERAVKLRRLQFETRLGMWSPK